MQQGQLNGSQQPQTQSSQSVEQASPEQEYASVVGLVNQADDTVVPLSKVISKELGPKVEKRIEKILARQEEAAALLDEAGSRLGALAPELGQSAEGGSAPTLLDSIAARKEMLSYGCIVLRASSGAYRSTEPVVSVWQCFIKGHEALQEASGAIATGTTKEVKAALANDKRALSLFQKASGYLDEVQQIAPGADLSTERNYAELQTQAAQAAMETDRALLDEDAKAARKHNAEYGKKASAAAKAAKSLPATTDDLVKSIYYSFGTDDVSVQDAQNKYEAAAKRAAKDDKELAALSE